MILKKHKYILSAMAALSLVACSTDDIVNATPEQPTTGYRLTFDGGVGVENQTRAHWSDLKEVAT